MQNISKKIDTYNSFVNGCDECLNYITYQYPYDFGFLKDKKNLNSAWFANFILFFAIFIEKYMVLLEDEKYARCFTSIAGKSLKEKKDNLRKLRNYLMHGSFYFEYENYGNIPEIVLTDNEGEKVISFNSISNLYNEIVSVIFMLNSKKTSSEKAEDCRLEYALFNNMNKISRLIKSDVFTKYEEYNPGYSYYYNDMTTAAVLVNFYATYNYGLETIFGPNMATVGDEQDFLKRVIESEYVDFSEFNFDLMDVKVSKNVSLVRTMPNQRKEFAEDNIEGIINALFTKITSGYIPEKYDYLFGKDINKIVNVCTDSVASMIRKFLDKIKALDLFFKEKYGQYADNFNTLFHLRNSYAHARIKIPNTEENYSGNILFVDRRGKRKTFEALVSSDDFMNAIFYDNRKIIENFIDDSMSNGILITR